MGTPTTGEFLSACARLFKLAREIDREWGSRRASFVSELNPNRSRLVLDCEIQRRSWRGLSRPAD